MMETPKVLDYDANPDAGWGAEELPLLHPFRFAGVEYLALAIKVPSGADVARFVANRAMPADILLDLASIDEKIVARMRGDDYARALQKVGEFLAGA